MKIVRLKDLNPTPWKNRQGLSTQMLIEPTGIEFPSDAVRGPFAWRVSCANVEGENDFSLFPGYDRWLIVWKGEGLILNGESLPPFSPLFFYGEEKIKCRLERGPIVDFGLIFQRERFRASFEIMTSSGTIIGHKHGALLIFCAENSAVLNGLRIEEGDLARFDGPSVVEVSANSRLFILRISDVS